MSCSSALTPASDSAAGAPTKVRAVTNPITIRPLRVVVMALMIGGVPFGNVHAEPGSIGVITSSPKAHDVVDGSKVPIILRFDALVDHYRSTLYLRSDRGARGLRPRLRSASNYLYSCAGHLTSGAYELIWDAQLSDGRTSSGAIPFTVR